MKDEGGYELREAKYKSYAPSAYYRPWGYVRARANLVGEDNWIGHTGELWF